jgi:hypothetical protein
METLKEHYYTHLRILEDGHRRERRDFQKQLKVTDMQALRITTTRLRRNLEERMKTEDYLCKELDPVKDMKLQLLHEAEMRTL